MNNTNILLEIYRGRKVTNKLEKLYEKNGSSSYDWVKGTTARGATHIILNNDGLVDHVYIYKATVRNQGHFRANVTERDFTDEQLHKIIENLDKATESKVNLVFNDTISSKIISGVYSHIDLSENKDSYSFTMNGRKESVSKDLVKRVYECALTRIDIINEASLATEFINFYGESKVEEILFIVRQILDFDSNEVKTQLYNKYVSQLRKAVEDNDIDSFEKQINKDFKIKSLDIARILTSSEQLDTFIKANDILKAVTDIDYTKDLLLELLETENYEIVTYYLGTIKLESDSIDFSGISVTPQMALLLINANVNVGGIIANRHSADWRWKPTIDEFISLATNDAISNEEFKSLVVRNEKAVIERFSDIPKKYYPEMFVITLNEQVFKCADEIIDNTSIAVERNDVNQFISSNNIAAMQYLKDKNINISWDTYSISNNNIHSSEMYRILFELGRLDECICDYIIANGTDEDVKRLAVEYAKPLYNTGEEGYKKAYYFAEKIVEKRKVGNEVDVLQYLFSLNYPKEYRVSCLIEKAIEEDKTDEYVECIISNGGDVNWCNQMGTSLLERYVRNSSRYPKFINYTEKLIQYGADINARNKAGKTVIDFAIDDKNQYMINLLLKNGAKTDREADLNAGGPY